MSNIATATTTSQFTCPVTTNNTTTATTTSMIIITAHKVKITANNSPTALTICLT